MWHAQEKITNNVFKFVLVHKKKCSSSPPRKLFAHHTEKHGAITSKNGAPAVDDSIGLKTSSSWIFWYCIVYPSNNTISKQPTGGCLIKKENHTTINQTQKKHTQQSTKRKNSNNNNYNNMMTLADWVQIDRHCDIKIC